MRKLFLIAIYFVTISCFGQDQQLLSNAGNFRVTLIDSSYYQIEATNIDYSYTTLFIEQYRWNKWLKIDTIFYNNLDTVNAYFHSGTNRFRIRAVDHSLVLCKWEVEGPKAMGMKPNCGPIVRFWQPTLYEVHDSYGTLIRREFSDQFDTRSLPIGLYYLSYDNTNETLTVSSSKIGEGSKMEYRILGTWTLESPASGHTKVPSFCDSLAGGTRFHFGVDWLSIVPEGKTKPCYKYNWEVKDNIITLLEYDMLINYQIVELTKDRMVLLGSFGMSDMLVLGR